MNWKIRRFAANLRQQDLALRAAMSTTRYSAIERAERVPSDHERKMIEQALPHLPVRIETQNDDQD